MPQKNSINIVAGLSALVGTSFGLAEKTYSQVTPDSVTYNIVGQPNLQNYYGKGRLAYYGSGDVTGNDTIDYRDLDAINSGILNNEGDINGNGTKGDSEDKQILSEYINGTRTHLPSDWDVLTPTEKKDWALKVYNNVLRPSYQTSSMPGWTCSTYARQALMENFGVINVEEYDTNYLVSEPELKNKENVGKFNLPIYLVDEKMLNESAHMINAFFIGENLNFKVGENYDISNFLFIDGATGTEVTPGTTYMSNTNNNLSIKWEGYYHNEYMGNIFAQRRVLEFNLNNSVLTCTYVNSKLTTQLNKIKPKFTKKTEVVVPYDEFKEKGLEVIVSENLPNDVHDDYDLSPTTEHTYVSGKTNSGNCTDFTFDIDVNFKAKNRYNKEESNSYKIKVKDEVKPTFTSFPEDIELNADEITGTIDPSETGYASATDNSGIVNVNYNYVKTSENSTKIYYDNIITANDLCGNDSTRVQKVIVNKPNDIDVIGGTEDKCKLKVYPNPIENNATIEFVGKGQNPKASICSISGQIIDSFTLDANKLDYSFSNYITGIYIIKIDAGDNCSDVQYITKVISK